jgi:hypothetical protein
MRVAVVGLPLRRRRQAGRGLRLRPLQLLQRALRREDRPPRQSTQRNSCCLAMEQHQPRCRRTLAARSPLLGQAPVQLQPLPMLLLLQQQQLRHQLRPQWQLAADPVQLQTRPPQPAVVHAMQRAPRAERMTACPCPLRMAREQRADAALL